MSLFAALTSTANSLAAYQKALSVTQNNVENASTPGYVRQSATFESLPFDGTTQAGGVIPGDVASSRDEFAENSVRTANSQLGFSEQQVASLTALQNQFDISGDSGVAAALSDFYTAAPSWSSSPNDTIVRQNFMVQAENVASAFQSAQAGLSQLRSNTDAQINGFVGQINSYAAQISQFNSQLANGNQSDPSLDASVHNTLENLSEIANVTVLKQNDGTWEVLLDGGQSALVAGTHAYPISADQGVVTDASGNDVTSQIARGKLAGALAIRNNVLPDIAGNATNVGSLNNLAKAFAVRVNQLLTSGKIATGGAGTLLFSYDASNAAASLHVSGTASQLAAVQPASVAGRALGGTLNTTSNNLLNLKVDGVTYNLTLNSSATASRSSVAADITTKLTAAGSTATARIDSSGQLHIVSGSTSDSASVEVLAGSANSVLGLSVGTGTSYVSNGVALSLASLANGDNAADQINGQSFTGFFGSIAAGVGAKLSSATSNQTTQQDLLTQAQTLRQQSSGIDLNQEATQVLEFQRSYQAASKLITVIDEMVQSVLGLIQS
jgi:flagellar hook-associated protein 1